MLKLKLQYSGHLMWRSNSLEKTLILGKIEGRRRRGWQGTRLFDGITDSMDMSLSELRELVKDREAWHAAVQGIANSWIRLSNWTKLIPEGTITAICINFKKCYVTIYRYRKTKRLIETFKLNIDFFFSFLHSTRKYPSEEKGRGRKMWGLPSVCLALLDAWNNIIGYISHYNPVRPKLLLLLRA